MVSQVKISNSNGNVLLDTFVNGSLVQCTPIEDDIKKRLIELVSEDINEIKSLTLQRYGNE